MYVAFLVDFSGLLWFVVDIFYRCGLLYFVVNFLWIDVDSCGVFLDRCGPFLVLVRKKY